MNYVWGTWISIGLMYLAGFVVTFACWRYRMKIEKWLDDKDGK